MADHTESDSAYVRGRIEGYLHGVAQYAVDDTSFDQERWEELYGNQVIFNSIPAWSSDEAREHGEEQVILCDWEEATETKYLKDGVNLPLDRSGTMVFEDGTVVMVSSGTPLMFTLGEEDTELIERWDEIHLEMLRDAYDYQPD